MAIKCTHDTEARYQFCTFTCYKWLPLFELTNTYDTVYKWFDYLKSKQIEVSAYVIMPNHIHVLLYFIQPHYNLNTIISNAKRFMAYEIVRRLKEGGHTALLVQLQEGLAEREQRKGQLHKVFKESFDAKAVYTDAFFDQKLDYIHHNPVSGKWQLVSDYTIYPHSSAGYYEKGIASNFIPFDYRKEAAAAFYSKRGLASQRLGEDPA